MSSLQTNYERGLCGFDRILQLNSIHPLALHNSPEIVYRNRTINNTNRLMWSKICSMAEALCERLRGCTAGYTIENSRTAWISQWRRQLRNTLLKGKETHEWKSHPLSLYKQVNGFRAVTYCFRRLSLLLFLFCAKAVQSFFKNCLFK